MGLTDYPSSLKTESEDNENAYTDNETQRFHFVSLYYDMMNDGMRLSYARALFSSLTPFGLMLTVAIDAVFSYFQWIFRYDDSWIITNALVAQSSHGDRVNLDVLPPRVAK